MTGDGTLVFTSDRPGGKGGYDLYIAEPVNDQYLTVANIAELNSPADEYSEFPDGKLETHIGIGSTEYYRIFIQSSFSPFSCR
jgi:hypothetical protein